MLAALACASQALAEPGEGLQGFAGLHYAYDDNLLRIAEGAPVFNGHKSDKYRALVYGLMYDKGIGRQDLYLMAKLTKVDFDYFRQLNYQGKDIQARWNYEIGNYLSGNLEGSYNRTLAPFTDFHTGERNLRTHKRQYLDVFWRLHPSFRLRSAIENNAFRYELSSQKVNDRDERMTEAGFDYISRAENTAGLVARKIKGTYHTRRLTGDDNFEQDELKARVHWRPSGVTQVQVLAGYAKRKHALVGEKDSSGANGRVTVTYTPRGKMTYSAAAWREFAALESTVVSYSLNRGASFNARWDVTGKTNVTARLSREKRAYNARVATPVSTTYRDALRNASLDLTTNPTRKVAVTLSAFRQSRSGVPLLNQGSYKAKGVSLSVNAQF
jgi:exopolysaccharide biosynthesis operon protein EpsL